MPPVSAGRRRRVAPLVPHTAHRRNA
jgi:hypothetical protein